MNPIAVLGAIGWVLVLGGSIGCFVFSNKAVAAWPPTQWSELARHYADLCFVVAMLGVTAIICAVLSG